MKNMMDKCIERVVVKETKTYIYYFNAKDYKIPCWLYWNKYSKMENVVLCSTGLEMGKGYYLLVSYK